MEVLEKEVLASAILKNWEISPSKEQRFSSDDVIEAYLTGKSEGLQETEKLLLDKLTGNISLSGNYSAKILEHLRQNKFNPLELYLKVDSWNRLSLLILLKEMEFVKPGIINIYEYISNLEENSESEFYSLNISICSISGEIANEHLNSDGYILKYSPSNV